MDQLEGLKDIFNEELSDISVSKKLRTKTLKNIFKEERLVFTFLKHNWMKTTTIFSIFVIMLTLSINNYIFDNNNLQRINPTNIEQFSICNNQDRINLLSNSVGSNEETLNDSCDIKP